MNEMVLQAAQQYGRLQLVMPGSITNVAFLAG
jgi:hypothetical protein